MTGVISFPKVIRNDKFIYLIPSKIEIVNIIQTLPDYQTNSQEGFGLGCDESIVLFCPNLVEVSPYFSISDNIS